MRWSEFQAKNVLLYLGLCGSLGSRLPLKCACVCVVQVCRKGKRRPSRVDRKREGWNNYVSAHRLFDLLKMQEKGVSPSDCQYIQCFTLWKHNTLSDGLRVTQLIPRRHCYATVIFNTDKHIKVSFNRCCTFLGEKYNHLIITLLIYIWFFT